LPLNQESPAQKAGLQEGDVIASLAASQWKAWMCWHRLLSEDRIGLKTPLIVLRGSRRLEVTVVS